MLLLALLCRCFSMRFVAMPLLRTAPLCRRKSSLCFAVAPLSTAAASLLISSPFAFRREAVPGRCFSPLLYALPLPRLALRYSALAFPSISIHCLSCSVHFCATALHCRAFPLRSVAELCLGYSNRCISIAVLGFSRRLIAIAALCNALPRLRLSTLFLAAPFPLSALLCLCSSKLRLAFAHPNFAFPLPIRAVPCLFRSQLCFSFATRICALPLHLAAYLHSAFAVRSISAPTLRG